MVETKKTTEITNIAGDFEAPRLSAQSVVSETELLDQDLVGRTQEFLVEQEAAAAQRTGAAQ